MSKEDKKKIDKAQGEDNTDKDEKNNKEEDKDENVEDDKEGDDDTDDKKKAEADFDVAKVDVETLAKKNPAVAKLLETTNTLKDKVEEINEKEEKRKKEEAEKEGNFQELYEEKQTQVEKLQSELKEANEHTVRYKETVSEIVDEMMKRIPERNRSLIREDDTPREKLLYIQKNAELLGMNGGFNKGDGVENSDDNSPANEEAKLQKRFNDLREKGRNGRSAKENEEFWNLSKKLKGN